MSRLHAQVLSWLFLVAVSIPAPAAAATIERLGLYVVVSDIDSSTRFYEALFEVPPSVRSAGFVGFTVGGGLYALVDREVFAPLALRGDNVVPYLRVSDIDGEFERVRTLAPKMLSDGVVDEGTIRLFRFVDPDGNVVEFFALVSAPRP